MSYETCGRFYLFLLFIAIFYESKKGFQFEAVRAKKSSTLVSALNFLRTFHYAFYKKEKTSFTSKTLLQNNPKKKSVE
jgi:hypothetical protein